MSVRSPQIISLDTDAIAAKTLAAARKLGVPELVERLRVAIQRRDNATMRMHRAKPDSLTWRRELDQQIRNTEIMTVLLTKLRKFIEKAAGKGIGYDLQNYRVELDASRAA